MFQKDVVFYLGKEKEDGFSGVIAEDGFLVVLEVEDGLSRDEGREKLNLLKEYLVTASILHLSDLETLIHEKIKEYNLPANVSLAVGYVKDTILYLKTVGMGKVYLRRGNQFGEIISGEQSASGRIHEQDLYFFTTDHFIQTFGGEKEVKKIFDHKKPHEIIDEITPQLKGNGDEGMIALFAQFNKKEEVFVEETKEEHMEKAPEPLFISKTKPWEKIAYAFQKLYAKTQEYSQEAGPKKKYTLIAVIIIFLILVWSVGLGYSRRNDANLEKKIQVSKENIRQKLAQADEAAFLDVPRSLVFISEARQELEKLKNDVSNKKQKELNEINEMITNEENKITKKEEKKYEEFFDLAVDNKEAKGIKAYLDDDNLSILDTAQGIIYTLSITKKSLGKEQFQEIKNAKEIAHYQNDTLFFTNDGFFKVTKDGKLNKIIAKDPDWGDLVDMWIYNGNIYVLDRGKDQIYKYLVAENGYSNKTSYFKGGSAGLKDSNSLAIDSSVYVGFSDHIFKFTAGVQDEFKTSFPDSNIHIAKIFTTKDLEKVYALDKEKGSIYILGKNGTYEREAHSPVLKQTDDMVIYQNKAYLLSGQKIYVMDLE